MELPVDNPKGWAKPTEVMVFVDALIRYYESRAKKYGNALWRYKVCGLVFSITVTVISGIPLIKDRWPWGITIAAGLATFFTGMLTLSKAQEYYLNAGSQQGKVEGEKLLYLGNGGPYGDAKTEEDRIRVLAERVHVLYAEGRQNWEGINLPKSSN